MGGFVDSVVHVRPEGGIATAEVATLAWRVQIQHRDVGRNSEVSHPMPVRTGVIHYQDRRYQAVAGGLAHAHGPTYDLSGSSR